MTIPLISKTTTKQSIKIKIIRYAGILVTLVLSILFTYLYFTQSNTDLYNTVNLYYSPVVAGIAFVLILARAFSSPSGANSRKAYFGIALAVFFYFLGETTFVIQYFVYGVANGGTMPYPFVADIFWAIGTVFFIDELFFIVRVIKVNFSKKQLTFIYTITAFSVLGLIQFVFGDVITSSYSVDYTPFMKAMDLYYFVGDVLILFATIYVVFGLFSKTGFKLSFKHLSWFFLILGNFSMIIGDAVYSFFGDKGTNLIVKLPFYTITFLNNGYSIDNILYMSQYMFWALCFGFFPAYLSRSFGAVEEYDEFTPIEAKANMDFTVPSVHDSLVDDSNIITANSLTFNMNEKQTGSTDTITKDKSSANQSLDKNLIPKADTDQPLGSN